MKLKMVETRNVLAIKELMQNIQNRSEQVPGLGLVYGCTGYGKTRAAVWYAVHNSSIYVRAKEIWTPAWMLRDISYELGVYAYSSTERCFLQLQKTIAERKKLIIIDQADYIEKKNKLLNTIMDLYDYTAVPFVLVGTEELAHRLARHNQFWRRTSQVAMMQPLGKEEVTQVAEELCGLEVQDGATQGILQVTNGSIGEYVVLLEEMEKGARQKGQAIIDKSIVELAAKRLMRRGA